MRTCSQLTKGVLIVFFLCSVELQLLADPKDDIEFALGLARRGYFEMAEQICEKVRKDPAATESDKAELQLVSGNILRLQAAAEGNAEKREQLLERAIQQFETFINGVAGSEERKMEARFTVGELLMQRGRVLGEKYKQETDPAARSRTREAATSRFKKAEEYLQKMIEFTVKEAERKKIPIEDDLDLMEARRLLPLCKYYHSLLYERGSAEHKKLLSGNEGAIQLLLEFVKSYEGLPSAYDAGIVLGLCYLEQSSFDDADTWFSYATDLKDSLKEAEGISEQMKKIGWDIVYRGYYAKCKGFREVGKPDIAIKSYQELYESCPDMMKHLYGKAAALEGARAYLSLRQFEKAREIAEEVLASDPGPLAASATEIVDEVTRAGVGVSTRSLKQTMDKSYDERKWQETIRRARTLLNAVKKGDPDYDVFVPAAYMAMGKSYYFQGRPLEAAAAFARLYEDFPTHPQAPEAAFKAVVALNDVASITKHPADRRAYRDILDVLDSRYRGHPHQKNVPYLQGREFELEGKYLEAADNYARVEETASMYEEAFARVGFCYYKHATGLFDAAKKEKDETKKAEIIEKCKRIFKQAEDHFKKYVTHSARQDILDPERIIKMNESRFSSLVCLGQMYLHELVNRPHDVLPLFTEEELKRYSTDPDKMSRAYALIVEAYIGSKKLPEAQNALEIMIANYPAGRRMPLTCRKMAIALDNAAKEAKDRNTYVKLRKDMARYYVKWATEAPAAGVKVLSKDVESVVARLVEVAKESGERSWNEQAVILIEKLLAGKTYSPPLDPKNDAKKIETLRWQLARLYVELGDHRKAKAAYEEIRDAGSQNAFIFLELGEVYLTLSRGTSGTERQEYWKQALEMFRRVLAAMHTPADKYSEPWWRAMYGYVLTLFESGEYTAAKEGIDTTAIARPDLGEKWGYNTKLNDLRRKIEAKLPQK